MNCGKLIGRVQSFIEKEDGSVVLHEEKNNLVVNQAQFSVMEALSGLASGHIGKFKFGAYPGTASPDKEDQDNSDPSAIVKNFQGLGTDIVPTGRETELTLILNKDEGNGPGTVYYTEMTLHSVSGRLIARYVFTTPIPKDGTIRFRMIWTLGYA